MTQDQIIFLLPTEKKRALKAYCAGLGVTMTDVMVKAVDRELDGDDAQPSDIDALVTTANALVNALPDCALEWAQSGGLDNTNTAVIVNWRDKVRAALAPFVEVGE